MDTHLYLQGIPERHGMVPASGDPSDPRSVHRGHPLNVEMREVSGQGNEAGK